MIKAKVKDVVVSNRTLVRLFDEGKTKNIKLLYKLMFLKKSIAENSDPNSAYTLTREKILKDHLVDPVNPSDFLGTTDDEKAEHGRAFYKEMEELGENDLEIKIDPFTMEDLESIAMDNPLTPTELFSLIWLLDYKDLEVQPA